MICRCSGSSWTWSTQQRARFSSETGSGDALQNKSSAPLDPEWVEMATKQLKGADPHEKLTWRTPEVQIRVLWGTSAFTHTHTRAHTL